MKLRPRLILPPSSFLLEEGRDNAAATPFCKTRTVGRIVPPLPHYFAKLHKPVGKPSTHFNGFRPARDGWLRRVGLSSLWLLAARLAGQALGLLFTAAIARSLGQAGLGQFAFISAVVLIGNAATTFGLDTLLIRDVAAARAAPDEAASSVPQTISAVLLIQLTLAAVFVAGLWLLAPRLPNQSPDTLPALRLAALALFPLAFSTVDSALLRAHERMGHFLVFTLVTATALALGGLVLAIGGGGLTAAAGVFVVAQVAGALAAAGLARRGLPGFRRRWVWPSSPVLGRALRLGAGLAALMLLSLLYQRSGVLLLSLLEGDAAAGAYSAAARVVEALKMLPAAFFGAMFPILAQGRRGDGSGRVYRRAFAALLAVAVLLAALTTALAGPIMALLFGPGYESAAGALRLMAWSLPPTVVAFKLSFDLVVAGRERAAAVSMALTLLIGGGLTAWLIGGYGLTGAALGLVAGEVAQVAILKSVANSGNRQPLEVGR